MPYTPGHHCLDYVEIASHDLVAVKAFFTELFGWVFTDYGEDYVAFDDGRLNGGFYRVDKDKPLIQGAALIVFYSAELDATKQCVEKLGGQIVQDVFSFPGGKRFHFSGPDGLEYAIWSE